MLPYIKLSFRRILKSRFITSINVIGLTIGIFVSLALINYYLQEKSYDQYHTNADRVFKAISRVKFNKGAANVFPITFGDLGENLKNNFEAVENTARIYGPFTVEVDLESQRFNNQRLIHMDYSFFELFDMPGIEAQNYNSPNDAILSREAANKLFDGDAIGKEITVENITYIVSAIADIPKNTVFQFDIVLPIEAMPYHDEIVNGGLEVETYVLLKEGADPVPTIGLLSDHYNELMESKWEDIEASNFFLPIRELYLNKAGVKNRLGNGNPDQLIIILSIALVVLALALINYMNLQIASNHARMIEMRLKKILGANKKILVKQGTSESMVVLLFASILAIAILDLFYRSNLSSLFGKENFTLEDWSFIQWGIFVISLTIIGLITGSIPSIKLFNRAGYTQQMIGDKRLGKFTVSLVVFQFFITSALLITILFVNKQMDFLRNRDKGYDSEQVVMISNLGENHLSQYEVIRSQLLQSTDILNVGGAQSAPGSGASGQFVHRLSSPDEGIETAHIRTLKGYAKTLQLNFIQGGDFTIDKPGGESQFILNQTAAKLLFKEDEQIIGQVINMSQRVGKVVGVVEDFHYLSLKYGISPLIMNIEEPYKLTLMAKVQAGSAQNGLNTIEQVLSSIDPLYVFDYQFLDDRFEQTYRSEMRTKNIITYATLIAFSISIMGLLALSLFVINAKIKEIAIRKTLGGSQAHIFVKLSSQLISWILIGNLLAIPVSWFIARNWVQDFVYQIDLMNLLWMGAFSILITLIASLGVIVRKLHKTMNMNPVEFLRNE